MAKSNRKLIDLTGQVFGRWAVVKETTRIYRPSRSRGVRAWICVCACGNARQIEQPSLTSGNSRSCGCLNSEMTAARNESHGMSHLPEYRIWADIIKRTENPNSSGYHNYGGRGIRMSSEWRQSFAQFFADMGSRPSLEHEIERRDNDGPYSAANCYWATHMEQAHNKRNNRWLTYQGETLCWSEWGRRLETSAGTIQGRLKLGWSIEQTVTTPVGQKR